MHDQQWDSFLQWALPRLHMRWPGFRRVRGQVCKRLRKRLGELGLDDAAGYRLHLETHPGEWDLLDGLCRVVVSRFYRDRPVFLLLEQEILPELLLRLQRQGDKTLRVWSAGCASGEEPYTLAILWQQGLAPRFAKMGLDILATDADPALLQRAAAARYPLSAVKNLPPAWRREAFQAAPKGEFQLAEGYRQPVRFLQHDVRSPAPEGSFQLIFCRNLVFTYFDEPWQRKCLANFQAALLPGGLLLLGIHERLPHPSPGFTCLAERQGLYRRTDS